MLSVAARYVKTEERLLVSGLEDELRFWKETVEKGRDLSRLGGKRAEALNISGVLGGLGRRWRGLRRVVWDA